MVCFKALIIFASLTSLKMDMGRLILKCYMTILKVWKKNQTKHIKNNNVAKIKIIQDFQINLDLR